MALVNKYDATANDSNKSWTVPDGKTWRLEWAHVILVTTVTGGNRQLVLKVLDDSNVVIGDWHAGTTQAASLTGHYSFQQGIYRETAFVNTSIQIAIPTNLILLPGWSIQILDTAAVDAAADDMTVALQVTEHALGRGHNV